MTLTGCAELCCPLPGPGEAGIPCGHGPHSLPSLLALLAQPLQESERMTAGLLLICSFFSFPMQKERPSWSILKEAEVGGRKALGWRLGRWVPHVQQKKGPEAEGTPDGGGFTRDLRKDSRGHLASPPAITTHPGSRHTPNSSILVQ